MEACTTVQDIQETPANTISWFENRFLKSTFVGLAFGMVFSMSFVFGFYWVGPVLHSVRDMI